MRRLIFDLESNGLLNEVTKVHCIAAIDIDTGKKASWGPTEISKALRILNTADVLIAHNGIGYDFPVLEKLYGWIPLGIKRDTLLISRLIYSDIKNQDLNGHKLPPKFIGKHSLEAWGHRLGIHKGDYKGGWETFSEDMLRYMEQDVEVTLALWKHLKPDEYSQQAIELEHRVAEVTFKMEQAGWPFDVAKAGALHATLVQRKEELEKDLKTAFGHWYEEEVFIPKRPNKTLGYTGYWVVEPAWGEYDDDGNLIDYHPEYKRFIGEPFIKKTRIDFNPNSRVHIEKVLRDRGWEPEVLTETGRAQLDDEVLETLDIPDAKPLAEYFLIQKRLGQLAEGNQAWLKMVTPQGRIHGRYNTNGTVTGRNAHHSPNLGQVPACGVPYGKECRELFTVPSGWSLLGADQQALELRCLANDLWKWDNGAYAEVVCNGDVHTHNQQAAGLPTRNNAKTFIYGWLYGAGPGKIGQIVNGSAEDGRKLIHKFLKALPAVGKLKEAVGSHASKKGSVPGLDGRRVPIRSEHAALNSRLQNSGAVICKEWLAASYETLIEKGYRWGWDGDFVFVGWIHDEIQCAVRKGLEQEIGDIIVQCARNAGRPFAFRCPLDSSYSVGTTWADTH